MQNRRDQVQAHTFVVGRLVSALQRADPDSPMSPNRRYLVGTVCGVLLAGLLVAVFGIVGVVSPGGNRSWQEKGALVVEKETGARYVLVDGQLRPVLNYASARLILGGDLTVTRVSQNSLRGVPHGLPVGIQGAPDSLPNLRRGDGRAWQLCSSTRPDVSGAPQPYLTMWVGGPQLSRPLGGGEGLLVKAPNKQVYLVWNGRRYRVPGTATVGALGYAAAPQSAVAFSWVNALPSGPDLVAPEVPGQGRPGPRVDGHPTLVGQVLRGSGLDGGGSEFYLVHADGLAPMTATQAALTLAAPDTARAYPGGKVTAVPISSAGMAAAVRSRVAVTSDQLPATPPRLADVSTGSVPCVRLSMDAATGPRVRVSLGDPGAGEPAPAGPPRADRLQADRIVVEAGSGLLIRNQPAPGVADGALSLLVDTGVRYPVTNDQAVEALGYAGTTAVPVPSTLLSLLPVGPPLDRNAARRTDEIGAAPTSPGLPDR